MIATIGNDRQRLRLRVRGPADTAINGGPFLLAMRAAYVSAPLLPNSLTLP